MKYREFHKWVKSEGWIHIRTEGTHYIYEKQGKRYVVPYHGAKEIGFGPWIILSRHMEEICDGRNNLRILGSMFEAWFGALYLQEDDVGRGLQQCNDFLIRIIEKHIDIVQIIMISCNLRNVICLVYDIIYDIINSYMKVCQTFIM
jgi:mRNA interferase HicA